MTDRTHSDLGPESTESTTYALVAEFETVPAVMAASERVRDAGFSRWDVHSPMPIHGINVSMGLRPTILPWITLVHGVAGLLIGLFLVWWINAKTVSWAPTSLQGYEFFVSGKPLFSLPANIPILFEMTVLLAAIGTLLGMLGLNKLPMLHNPLFKSKRFRRVTNDRFCIVIEAQDPMFDLPQTTEFLQSLNPVGMELVTDD